MKKLKKEEWIAVAIGLGLVGYVFFSAPVRSLFSNNFSDTNMRESLPKTGVESQDLDRGDGKVAETGDIVTAHYIGRLPNGTVFDSSYEKHPIKFTLGVGEVIRGWDEGIVGMSVGGRRVLKIAPDYGYGSTAVGSVPANSTLIFEVELIDVEKP